MRKVIPLFTLFILTFSSIIGDTEVTHASPNELKQIEKDRKQAESNLSKKEKEIVKVLDEIENLHEEITSMEKEIAKQTEHIAKTEEKVMKYEDEFQQLIEETNELNKQIEARTDILNKQLAAYQENGGDITYLEVLFNAKSFIDFISRVTSVSTITGAERNIIEQQIDDKLEIEEIQESIIEKINKQEKLIADLEETKSYMDERQASLKKSQNKLKKQEKSLNKEKEKLTKENSQLKQVEKSYRKRMEARENEKKAKKVTKAERTNNNKSSSSKPKEENKNSEPLDIGETFRVEATAYTAYCAGCSGITSEGINLRGKNPPKVIAVDPSVIPLGSRVWVEGYGEAIAGDTGGAIKGNKIDVFVKSTSAARQWGRRTVTVKILN